MPELFQEQAARTPDATAVICGTRLRYAELNERANRLARYLVTLGAGPGQLVAIAMPRTPEMIIAVLAVLKAGAAYIPVDPAYPRTGSGTCWLMTSPGRGADQHGAGGAELAGAVARIDPG